MKKNNTLLGCQFVSKEDSILSPQKLLCAFRDMLFIRRFEERCADFYTQGRIRGFCHLCIGQEAISVALELARDGVDSIITSYRCHGSILACGTDPTAVMLELLGMEGGISKGKGGSMHLFSPARKFYGGHGIVGASSALGSGLAFAHKYNKDGGVCISCLGDGASNQGQFFESMNMASLWGLPVLYVIENNGYSMGTSVERGCANPNALYTRGEPFGIAGYQCYGDDFLEIFNMFKERITEIRDTGKPALLEVLTHRFKGHSMSDPGQYRSKIELDQAKKTRDPIVKLKSILQEKHAISVENIKEIEEEVKNSIQAIIANIEQAYYPAVETLEEDIYVE